MAWTTPKTWSNLDPLVASEFNTQFRDNLNALRAQSEDVQPKMNQVYPVFTGAKVHRAVYDMSTNRSTGSQTLVRVDSTLVLTFTPLSDEVLFSVQFAARLGEGNNVSCGIWKDNASYSIPFSSGNGSMDVMFFYEVRPGSNDNPYFEGAVHYMAPVSVTRGQSVSLYPSWKGNVRTDSVLPMILMAQEIGAFA